VVASGPVPSHAPTVVLRGRYGPTNSETAPSSVARPPRSAKNANTTIAKITNAITQIQTLLLRFRTTSMFAIPLPPLPLYLVVDFEFFSTNVAGPFRVDSPKRRPSPLEAAIL
jgi:hypothetical protein